MKIAEVVLKSKVVSNSKDKPLLISKNQKASSVSSQRPMNKLQLSKCNDKAGPTVNLLKIPSVKINNTVKLRNTAVACDRFRVKNRSATGLATALLKDIGLVTPNDSRFAINKNKIWRSRVNTRQKLSDIKVDAINALYFDGRKDKTLVQRKSNEIIHHKSIVEEHITLLQEPGSQYIGHTTPKSGKSIHLAESICEFFRSNSGTIAQTTFNAVGCDGTNANVGHKGGVIRRLELTVNRTLQYIICQLHGNELPLRHLFRKLDGETSGPTTFKGPIGIQLKKSYLNPIVPFKTIPVKLPKIEKKLSTDQQYLYDICHAISTGYCSISLANRYPGIHSLHYDLFVTYMNRFLFINFRKHITFTLAYYGK